MRPKTHTVESAYQARDGGYRVFVRGIALPLRCDEPLGEGTAVVVVGQTARRP